MENTNEIIPTSVENKKNLFVYQAQFVHAIMSFCKMLKDQSDKMELDNKIQEGKLEAHKKLRTTCESIHNEYKSGGDIDSNVNQIAIIKKSFYVLKDNLKLVLEKNPQLFVVRNKEGKITTIIPGVNINLVYESFDDEQKTQVWGYIYILFVSSVKMVYANTSEARHKKEILDAIDTCQNDLLTNCSSLLFRNVFMGLGTDNSGVDLESLMSKDINIPGTEASTGLLSSLGVDKLMNVEKLSDEIKNFSDTDMKDTVDALGELLGNDSDIKDVCTTMVKTVVDDVKSNGIESIFDIAQRISGKIGTMIPQDKMAKTAMKMGDLMQNNSDKLKDIKDDQGNPIGDQFLKQFSSALNMAKQMADKK
jgi:hypothetical protein